MACQFSVQTREFDWKTARQMKSNRLDERLSIVGLRYEPNIRVGRFCDDDNYDLFPAAAAAVRNDD